MSRTKNADQPLSSKDTLRDGSNVLNDDDRSGEARAGVELHHLTRSTRLLAPFPDAVHVTLITGELEEAVPVLVVVESLLAPLAFVGPFSEVRKRTKSVT